MKKPIIALIFLAFFPSFALFSELNVTIPEQQELFTTRNTLLNKLTELDLRKICERNSSYLEALGADYDEENQRYFIEQKDLNSTFNDSTCLIMIDYRRSEEAQITIFLPEKQSHLWLSSRISFHNGALRARIVFQPFSEPADLTYISYCTDVISQISMSQQ